MEEKKTVGFLKGKPIIAIAMAAAVLISFGITWAYYTSKQALANPLTTAHSGAAIVEEYNPNSSFLPGETVTKKVAFQNTGKMDIFLRVEVPPEEYWQYMSDEMTNGILHKKGDIVKDGDVKDGENGLLTSKVEKIWTNYWKIGEDDCEWSPVIQENGKAYRYYLRVLEPGDVTHDILSSIKLSEEVSNDRHSINYSNKCYVLTFNAEAVPVEDHGGQLGQSSWNMSVSLNNDGKLTWTQVGDQSDGQSN